MNVPNDPSALIELCKLVAPINAVKFTINASPITNTFLVMRHLSECRNPVFFVLTLTNCASSILSNCIVRSARFDRPRFKSRSRSFHSRVIVVEHVCHTYPHVSNKKIPLLTWGDVTRRLIHRGSAWWNLLVAWLKYYHRLYHRRFPSYQLFRT